MTILYAGNTNELMLRGLRLESDGTYLNAAALTVTVKTLAGVNVAGAAWPKTMDYVAGSNGDYRAVLEDTIAFVPGEYVAAVEANAGVNRIARWTYNFMCQVRTVS